MLKKYTPELKKISMGILTYNYHRIKTSKLEAIISQLVNGDNELYLWQGPDKHYDGLLTVEKFDESFVVVKNIILHNNFKNTAGYNNVLNDLKKRMPHSEIMGVENLKDIFLQWEKTLSKTIVTN